MSQRVNGQPFYLKKVGSNLAGFTLVEMIVVIGGLSILAGLAIPNVLKANKFAQLDEAKALLNSAAVECLQKYREDQKGYKTWQPLVLKEKEMDGVIKLPGNYQYKDDLKTCEEIYIHDPSSETSLLMDLSFDMQSRGPGKIYKTATSKHPDSEKACIAWGSCGGSESAKYLKACFLKQSKCGESLSEGLKTGIGLISAKAWAGQCTWPAQSPEPSCSTDVWSCNGVATYSDTAYEACVRSNSDAKCLSYRDELKDKSHNGPTTPDAYVVLKSKSSNGCNVQIDGKSPTWWYEGSDVGTETAYGERVCEYELGQWNTATTDGEFKPDVTSYYGTVSCDKAYKCSGSGVTYSEYIDSCGNACNNDKVAWLAKGGDGKLAASASSCSSDIYKCDGNEVIFSVYEDTCGAKPTPPPKKCCTAEVLASSSEKNCTYYHAVGMLKSYGHLVPKCCGDKEYNTSSCPSP